MVNITSPDDLWSGDLFFGPIGGLTGIFVGIGQILIDGGFRVNGVNVKHVGVIYRDHAGELWIIQAMPTGAECVPFDPALHWDEDCMYVRIPVDYAGQNDDAAEIARAMVAAKVQYSFLSYLALALWRWHIRPQWLEDWIDRRGELRNISFHLVRLPKEAICSVLADQAWSLAGKQVMHGVAHQCVTPSTLAGALMRTGDVIVSWPSDHPLIPER